MVSKKPVYIAASLIAILGLITVSTTGHFSAFAQGSDVNVSIKKGAGTTLTGGQAYSMDPIQVKVGQKVIWKNDDTVQHTVTSGTGPSDPNMGKDFDSGLTKLINPGATFEHTFTKAGTFPYFCQLHPTMQGKVIVS
jgi:plastocyanin